MRSLLYAVILLVAAGCGYSNSSILQELDATSRLMQTDPSAAMERLNEYDVSSFTDSATMAKWALLYSEAMVANNLSAPNDTIVGIAIAYYGNNNYETEFKHASRLKALMADNTAKDKLATALYLQKEKEYMLYKERVRSERIIFFTILVLVIACTTIIWLKQRLKLQNVRNTTLIAEASGLRNSLETKSNDINRLEGTLHGLLDTRFALIDSLCQSYYESQGTKSERKVVVDKVKAEIEAVRNDAFAEMEQAVNDCRDGMLDRVKEACPQMKTEDYRLLVYVAGSLSTRTISLLLDETPEVVYKRKSRLKARIKAAIPDFESIYPGIFQA